MSITVKNHSDGKQLEILISGVLGNVLHREFRHAYESATSESYVVNLNNAENIDSSGLGMLLLLRDFAGGDNANITIINCSPTVLSIFKVTCFYRLFDIPEFK